MATVLITGSSSGIGYEFARIFARDGYDLILVSRTKTDVSDEDFSSTVITDFQLDLSKPESVEKLKRLLIKHKLTVDILVNNAGFGDYGYFQDAAMAKLGDMIELNVTTLTALTHAVLPAMIHQKQGRIINVASVAAFLPGPYMAVYYATKHYVLAFSESLAEELAGSGITVTALCPGPTASKFQSAARMEGSQLVKGRRLPTSKEVAEYGYSAAMQGKRIAIHGWRNKVAAFAVRILPRTMLARLVKVVSGQ